MSEVKTGSDTPWTLLQVDLPSPEERLLDLFEEVIDKLRSEYGDDAAYAAVRLALSIKVHR